ncbi:hypothetical protein AOQ73_15290 [Bradyrhizobium pachyrhizi]|nr:hypothetical protein AOQ73_15290 [Bradyrhizobium pachyrhizi]
MLGKPLEAGVQANALDGDRQHFVGAIWRPMSLARQHGSDLVVVHLGAGELERTHPTGALQSRLPTALELGGDKPVARIERG